MSPWSSQTPPEMLTVHGLGVSGGIAIGRAIVIETRAVDVFRFPLTEADIGPELDRFHEAVAQARREVERTRDHTAANLGDELGAIFDAHLLVLADPGFLARVEEHIRDEQVNAEWALHKTAEEVAEAFARMGNEYLAERGADIQDVVGHLMRQLQGLAHHELKEIDGPVVIVADDLAPSEAVRLGREKVVGFAIESGGRTSHTTIIARSLKIPAVSGVKGVTALVTDEAPVIIDGEAGLVVLHPTAEVLADYERRVGELARRELGLRATRDLEACTADGTPLALMANIDLPEELPDAVELGAQGIGLYRSEFLYIEKSPELPTEEDHLALYRQMVESAAPHPAIIRTYDLGGRKLAAQILDSIEENPVLGLRGIRLTLARPEVFRIQLRALFRAAAYGDLWIMVPLVSSLDEVRRFRTFCDEVLEELAAEGVLHRRDVKIGIMIEVPSAALIADILAREVDFFSLGTNDLIQYSLAVDRNNEHVADLYQPLHPAILRMLYSVIRAGHAAGIEVSLCGEMATDPRYAALLVGLGLRRLSVTPRLLPQIKTRLRSLAVADLRELAESCLDLPTAADVEARLDAFLSLGMVTADALDS
ncbi:MAG: phosphoenolpyruvate--protein phosphotransferase [Thermoanaerobaculia bacterium]|nr:phosphoenolpyruvate--protein phosphotransferase [Thermoanaerobaculia bacterium]